MRKKLGILICTLLVSGCGNVNSSALNKVNKRNGEYAQLSAQYVEASKRFASTSFSKITNDNFIFSPMSIETTYALILDGSDGNSKKQLSDALNFSNVDYQNETSRFIKNNMINNAETKLSIDQSLWIDYDIVPNIKDDFIKNATDKYFTELYKINYAKSKKDMVNWAMKKSHSKIKMSEEEFGDGPLVIMNSIYLKANWDNQFDERDDTDEEFNNLDNSKSKVTMMNNYYQRMAVYSLDDAIVFSLKLSSGLSVNYLLPNEIKSSEYLNERVDNLLNYSSLDWDMYNVHLATPKFQEETNIDVKDILIKEGVNDIYNKNNADLSSMSSKGLYIEKSVQKSHISFDHKGVEGASVTSAILTPTSPGPAMKEMEIKLNRPFIYSITDNDGLPLFIGKKMSFK